MVVVSCTAGVVLFLTVVVEVVVVVGATGFSTTVVHDVNNRATAKSGVRMISFFIVGVVSFTGQFDADASTRCISGALFELCSLIVGSRTQSLCSRSPTFRLQNPFLQSARARPSLSANLFPTMLFGFAFLARPAFEQLSQAFSREFAVMRLRPGILNGNAETGGQMTKRYGR